MFCFFFFSCYSLTTLRGIQGSSFSNSDLSEDIRIDQCFFHNLENSIYIYSNSQKNVVLIASGFSECYGNGYNSRAVYIEKCNFECRVTCFYKCNERQGALSVQLDGLSNTVVNIDMNTFRECQSKRHTMWLNELSSKETNILQNNNFSQSSGSANVGIIHIENSYLRSYKNILTHCCGVAIVYHSESDVDEEGIILTYNADTSDYAIYYKDDGGTTDIIGSYFFNNTYYSDRLFYPYSSRSIINLKDSFVDKLKNKTYWGSIFTTSNVQTLSDESLIPSYTFLGTLSCHAEIPYPLMSPTFMETPFMTPFMTLPVTPIETLFDTPFQTLFVTPIETQFQTLYNTRIETLYNTPFQTLYDTPFQTLFVTPIETQFQTLYSTQIETLYNTPFETLYDTHSLVLNPSATHQGTTIITCCHSYKSRVKYDAINIGRWC